MLPLSILCFFLSQPSICLLAEFGSSQQNWLRQNGSLMTMNGKWPPYEGVERGGPLVTTRVAAQSGSSEGPTPPGEAYRLRDGGEGT